MAGDGAGKAKNKGGRPPKAGRLEPNAPLPDVPGDSPSIVVGETPHHPTHEQTVADLLAQLPAERQKEVDKEARRAAHAQHVGRIRWDLALTAHKLEDGNKLNFDDYPFQVEIYRDAAIEKVIYGSAQWGKALRSSTRIHLPGGGVKPIGELRVGDRVSTPFGGSSRVAGVFPQGRVQLYRLTLADGRAVDACAEHLWRLHDGPVLNTAEVATRLRAGMRPRLPVAKADGPRAWVRPVGQEVVAVEPAGVDDATCIAVDHPSRLFVTANGVVSHNTEYGIVTAIAQAAAGMRVLYINAKKDKRERLVKTRIDPSLKSVKVYKELARKAALKGKDTFSTMIKHLGDGSIVFLIASADREFSQQSADSAFVDEYDECEGNNIFKLDDRMSGSWMRFKEFVGNPTLKGTEGNQNIDWQFQNSDQRYWNVACATCKEPQVLDWEQHVVDVERNEHGGILSVAPRDPEYKTGGRLDMRPICVFCRRPLNRLSHDAFWKPMQPGHPRHGYNLSNLYNPNKRLDELFRMYLVARHSPEKMQFFINNQLGKPHNQEGTGITDEMLAACSTGKAVGLAPYRFVPAEMLQWGAGAASDAVELPV